MAQWSRNGQFPVAVRAAHDGKTLYLSFAVKDGSPWVNNGKDWQLLFKTGDSVDLQLGADPTANPQRSAPVPGDLRLLIAPFQGGNIAVLYRHRLPDPQAGAPTDSVVFQCPWRSEKVDSVRKLASAKIAVNRSGNSYLVKAAVPLGDLGLDASAFGKLLRCDFGVIYGDAEGTTNIFRNYWSNQATGLVNDVPGEIMLTPNLWGRRYFGDPTMKKPIQWVVAALTCGLAALPLHAEVIRCAGVLGNSGEQGTALVRFNGEKPALGLGVVADRYGTLWDRAGVGVLNRYAADGRLLASYRIPGQRSPSGDALAAAGDTLILCLDGGLHALPIDAPPGSTSSPLKIDAEHISLSSHDGWVVASKGPAVFLVNAAGAKKPVITLPRDPWELEIGPEGTVFVIQEGKAYRAAADAPGGLALVGAIPGERTQFLGGYLYGAGYHSTLRRFDGAWQPAPGVVLGGNSGSFIGHVDEQSEVVGPRGLAKAGPDLFAISGRNGILHLLEWQERAKRLVPLRRIGSVPSCLALALDGEGRTWWLSGNWNWNDGPATPLHFGIPEPEIFALAVQNSDSVVGYGRMWGKPSRDVRQTGQGSPHQPDRNAHYPAQGRRGGGGGFRTEQSPHFAGARKQRRRHRGQYLRNRRIQGRPRPGPIPHRDAGEALDFARRAGS